MRLQWIKSSFNELPIKNIYHWKESPPNLNLTRQESPWSTELLGGHDVEHSTCRHTISCCCCPPTQILVRTRSSSTPPPSAEQQPYNVLHNFGGFHVLIPPPTIYSPRHSPSKSPTRVLLLLSAILHIDTLLISNGASNHLQGLQGGCCDGVGLFNGCSSGLCARHRDGPCSCSDYGCRSGVLPAGLRRGCCHFRCSIYHRSAEALNFVIQMKEIMW